MPSMRVVGTIVTSLVVLAGVGLGASTALAQSEADLVARGEYLVAIGGCTDCHTDGMLLGQPDPERFLAGAAIGFFVPELGVLYPPNLTPDRETGLGAWSRADLVRALKEGQRPDGSPIRPPMPVWSTAKLTDADAEAMAAYLQSLPATRHAVPKAPVPVDEARGPYMTFVFPQ